MLWETKLALQGQLFLYVFRVEVVEMGLRVWEMMSIYSRLAPTTRTTTTTSTNPQPQTTTTTAATVTATSATSTTTTSADSNNNC